MAAKKRDRDPPAPGREAVLEVQPVDPEHPKRSLPPVTLSTSALDAVVEDLERFEPGDAPVLSAYWSVPADPGETKGAVAALKDLAKDARRRAGSADLSHAVRMSVLADVDRMLELEELAPLLRGRTLAFFRCARRGLEEAVAAPGGLPDLSEIDATPFLRPLVSVLTEAHRYAVAVVDREHAQLFEYFLGTLDARDREHGRALRNPNYAEGDREYETHRKAEELAKRHFRESARALRTMVERDGVELVVLGGHQEDVAAFCEELPADLRRKVVGRFTIDPQTMTPAAARDAAQRAIDDYERRQEVELVAQVTDRVGEGRLGALGLDWCLLATVELAVDQLLVDDGVRHAGWMCDRCGWLGLSDVCPIDDIATREVPDIVDEMATRVLDTNGRVRHIAADTPLRGQMVGALLRFPVPRPAGPAS